MGVGEGNEDKKDGSLRQRRFSRQSSACSTYSQDDTMIPLREGDGTASMGRKRTPSGKSVVSRTISLAEYHGDLKPSLKHGLTFNLILHSFIIWFGSSFIFGYNLGVLNQPSALIQDFYRDVYGNRTGEQPGEFMITFLWSLTNAIFFPGGMIGAFGSGFLANKVGRKRAILMSHVPAFIGAVVQMLCVVTNLPELLMIGRFIQGINCGLATGLAPMYLSEITPFNLRGAFGTGHQLFITIGIFMGSVFGLSELLGTPTLWPYLLLLNVVPAFVSLVVMPFMPESPRYLALVVNDRNGAEKALQFLRGKKDVSADMEEMETEASQKKEASAAEEKFTMKMLLTTADLRMPVLITVMLQIAQQFSGINCIFFYSGSIYAEAGVSDDAIQYAVIATNAVNVAMTIIALPIMDKAGRRPLLLYPMIVMTIDMAVITAALNLQREHDWLSFISIICVIVYVICFAVGLGPIPLMTGAELFRQGPRPMAMSLAGVTNWLCTTIIAISFELIQTAIKEFTFILFLILMIGFTAFVFFKVPETKNKTFEEIASLFQPGGTIEVEEVVDDPDYDLGADSRMGDEDFKVRQPNGSTEHVSNDEVFVKMPKDEEKRSLTRSAENIHEDSRVDMNPKA